MINKIIFSLTLLCCLVYAGEPAPPAIPEIQAFPEHEKITLYWDKSAENSIDPETGYADFEGYRLYRSSDGGETWGKLWDKVYDYSGNLVNWKPFAQFDLSEKQDTSRCIYSNSYDYETGQLCIIADSSYVRKTDISGYDPLALWVNLGDNTGIYRSYEDTTVIDGVEYTYAVTAYDMGLRSFTVEFLPDTTADSTGNIFKADTTWSPSNPDHFTGLNGLGYPSFETPRLKESFSDYNANGTWDEGEPFVDENDDDIWNDRINPINSITIMAGYFASNILFPDKESDDEIDKFIVSDSLNVGNGFRSYRVVNTGELGSGLIRFEIDACLDRNAYGDQDGSFATGCSTEAQVDCAPGCLELGPPSVYAYEVIDTDNFTPKYTSDVIISGFSNDSILFYMGLPGVEFNDVDSIVTLPEYIIENHKLTYLDDPNYTANWTEWFIGVQFRFDNGSELIPGGNNVIIRDFELSDTSRADTSLSYRLHGKFRYKANLTEFYSRPNYTYKIEFSTSVADTAYRVLPLSSCDHLPEDENGDPIKSPLPFKITNLTLDQEVFLWHYDKGIEAGAIEYNEIFSGSCDGCNEAQDEVCIFGQCQKRTGYKNCNWELNEILHFTDIIYTDNNLSGDDVKLFEFKLNLNYENYAKFVGVEPNSLSGRLWENGNSYEKGYIVYHEGMLYKAEEELESSQDPPDIWFDNNGDGLNDNPWQILYPWRDGDYLIIEPYKWFTDGDAWVVDLAQLGEEDNKDSDDLKDVKVVPNPYMVQSRFNEVPGSHLLRFARLPNICEISIYTVTGEFVRKISHNDPYDGNEWWDLKNGQGEFIAPGLYIYVVETPGGEKLIDKFAVIR